MIDLLESERIKDEIKASPEQVAQIIETTDLGICITDENGIFQLVNNRYCQIYGYTRDELIGKHFTMVVPDEKQTQLTHLHDKFIRDKEEVMREWEVVTKAGVRIKIGVDTGHSDTILSRRSHKITFIHPEE